MVFLWFSITGSRNQRISLLFFWPSGFGMEKREPKGDGQSVEVKNFLTTGNPTFAHTVMPCKIPRGTQVLSNSEVSEVISSWLDACFSWLLPVRMGFPMFFSPLIVLTAMNGLCESWATWVPCHPRFIIPMGRSYPWRPVAAWDCLKPWHVGWFQIQCIYHYISIYIYT